MVALRAVRNTSFLSKRDREKDRSTRFSTIMPDARDLGRASMATKHRLRSGGNCQSVTRGPISGGGTKGRCEKLGLASDGQQRL